MPRATDFEKVHKLMSYYYQRKGQSVTMSEVPFQLLGMSQVTAYSHSYRLVELGYLQYSSESGRFRWNVEMPFPDIWQVSERWKELVKNGYPGKPGAEANQKSKKIPTTDGKVKYLKEVRKQEESKELDVEALRQLHNVINTQTGDIVALREFLFKPMRLMAREDVEAFDIWQENEREAYIRVLDTLLYLANAENILELKKQAIAS